MSICVASLCLCRAGLRTLENHNKRMESRNENDVDDQRRLLC